VDDSSKNPHVRQLSTDLDEIDRPDFGVTERHEFY
jgi:hypothetical protein